MAWRFSLLWLLAAVSLVRAEDDDERKCGEEIESKVGKEVEAHGGDMSEYLKKHDSNGDGIVQEDELKACFKKAGVSEKCLPFVAKSMSHLQKHHDHNDDELLHVDELKTFRHGKDDL
eukprot:TRINITY_DN9120_c0_g1_i1.p2 TRINITY_DN9120_c0_g1~~TRINITY_DN9120_c0_g1_i1.p2  ORF type:complete len:118 (+),score=44.61 TRINITY_DN9120_c0_g1_i1:66-419(+)